MGICVNYVENTLDYAGKFQKLFKVAGHSYDTCVSLLFYSKTLDPLAAKIGGKQDNNTNFSYFTAKLTDIALPWQHE